MSSPKSPENEKTKRYDRQLRLWGENGQKALEQSHVCLINANTVGTEILKSLVLPGIRAFTIIDDHHVTEDDYDSNFFLCTEGSIGKPRATVAANLLLEMNHDVKKGDDIVDSFESLLNKDINFFSHFTIVIAANVEDERAVNKLSQALWSLNVPLLMVRSIGFLGYIRLQVREHAVMEPHPDDHLEDLRLDRPFPELATFLASFLPLGEMKRRELTRIPALVIISIFLEEWRKKNGKKGSDIPANYREKVQLANLIKEAQHNLQDDAMTHFDVGEQHLETTLELENFEEAAKMVNKVFMDSHKVPETLIALMREAKINDSEERRSSPFWIVVNALKIFINKYGCLPLSGSIPDMNCASEYYVAMQRIYKEKARKDVEKLLSIAQTMGNKICTDKVMKLVQAHIESLSKNARYLTVVRTGAIGEELAGNKLKKLAMGRLLNVTEEEGSEHNELRFYLLMRLVDRFYAKYNRYPGQFDDVENDITEFKKEFKEFCNDLGVNLVIHDELIHEICRYGGCELHSVSSLVGGCAAQETIKLITSQYVPIASTFVYSALTSKTATFDL